MDFEIEAHNKFDDWPEIKLNITEALFGLLKEDWSLVNEQRQLTTLPATLTVAQILENFVREKMNKKIALFGQR